MHPSRLIEMNISLPEFSFDEHSIILYTDGGCKPSRGIGGWGIHGYVFKDEEAKQGTGNPKFTPTNTGYVTTTGSGAKPPVTITHYVDGFGSLIPESTNNIAELSAVIAALRIADQLSIKKVILKMDSTYVLEGMTSWMHGWAKANWTKNGGDDISNVEHWRVIYDEKKRLEEKGVTFTLLKVKGHSGDQGNDLADANASRGIVAGRNGTEACLVQITDAKGYWNTKVERNRLFSQSRWFFQASPETQLTDDGRHIYYLGDPREDDELLGKKIADATFSVLYLKDPDPVLSAVQRTMTNLANSGLDGLFTTSRKKIGAHLGLMRGDLSKIFASQVYDEVSTYGDMLLARDFVNNRVLTADNTLLAEEIRPARLAFNAIDVLQNLENVMIEYLMGRTGVRLQTTDLTPILYESDTSKKKPVFKLKSNINSSMRSIKVDANCYTPGDKIIQEKLVLTLGLDLPDRNTLAAIAGESTKVVLLTWPESERAIRYATIVQTESDLGIWSGPYANVHLLKS